MARGLIVIGALLLIIGVLLYFAPGLLNWFGNLPGDVTIRTERTRIYIPITSTLLISVVLSAVIYFLQQFF